MGKVLPKDYQGCVNDDIIEGSVLGRCGLGQGVLAVYHDRMWAVGSSPIEDSGGVAVWDDPSYVADFNSCGSLHAWKARGRDTSELARI